MLNTSLKLLDSPFSCLVCWLVLESLTLHSLWKLKCDASSGPWHWELDNYLGRKVIRWEVSSHLDGELQLVLVDLVDEWVDSERCLVFSVDAVVHDQELAIRWVNSDSLHGFKVTRVHTLVEVAIVEHD